VAISYDEPDALAEFAECFGITYPMLSDPDSEIIREFEILNTLIAEDDHPWFGIPFPGVYVTDAGGRITAKFFENHLALRPGVDQLLRAVKGETVVVAEAAETQLAEVICQIEVDDTPVAPGILRELRVTLRVPDGQHLYGEPVPSGMVPTQVEIEAADNLVVLETLAPETHPLVLVGTGETLQVFDGNVVLRVPFSHSGAMATASAGNDGRKIKLAGRVRWQACDEDACGLPRSTPFGFTLESAPMNTFSLGAEVKSGEMDTRALLKRMTQRRAD
jgi:hypothetical protein